MLKINLSKDADKFLTRIQSKHAAQIARKLQQMQVEPIPGDAKQLKGYTFMRVDSGEYRIIYEADEHALHVILIGKRNDDEVYKKLKRK